MNPWRPCRRYTRGGGVGVDGRVVDDGCGCGVHGRVGEGVVGGVDGGGAVDGRGGVNGRRGVHAAAELKTVAGDESLSHGE